MEFRGRVKESCKPTEPFRRDSEEKPYLVVKVILKKRSGVEAESKDQSLP